MAKATMSIDVRVDPRKLVEHLRSIAADVAAGRTPPRVISETMTIEALIDGRYEKLADALIEIEQKPTKNG